MRKLLLFSFAFISMLSFSQTTYTFSNNTQYSIPDDDAYADDGYVHGANSEIVVSGIPPTAEIDHVTINLTHTYDGDLQIYLVYYDTRIFLSNRNGGSGQDYNNTTFTMSASTPISSGTADFNGSYIPDEALPVFNDANNPNGKWVLNVCDAASNDVGTIDSWEIVFKPRSCPLNPALNDDSNWNLSCTTDNDTIMVTSSDFSDNYPSLYFQFEADDQGDPANNTIGVRANGSLIYSNTIDNSSRFTVYSTSPGLSTDVTYSIDASNSDGTIEWMIFDGNGVIHSQGTVTNNTVTDQGGCSPEGTVTWDISPGVSGLYYWNSGMAYVDPNELGPGTYTVTYNWDNGSTDNDYHCSNTVSKTFTITNPFNSDWTVPSPVCESGAVIDLNNQLSASATSGGTWSGTGVSSPNFNPSGLSGNTSVTYYVGNDPHNSGCYSSTTQDINVIVPNVNATSNSPVCAGDDIVLNETGGSASSWQWEGPVDPSDVQSPTISNPTTSMSGTYNVTVTDANGCTATGSTSVTVNPLPTPSISGNTTVCENSTGESYSTTNSTGHSYSWNVTGGTIASGNNTNNITVDWGNSGTGTVSVTETIDATGCSASVSQNITVNPLPTPSISGNTTVCANSTETYSVSNTSGHSYSWNVSGGTIASGAGTNTITVNWGNGASGTVSVTETIDATGCSADASENITINALPVVYAGGDQSIANGTSTTIDDATVNGSTTPTGFTYSWSPASELTDATVLHPTTNNLSSTTIFTLTVEDLNTHCTNSDDVTITVTGGALSVSTSGNETICEGSSVTITANGSGGSGNYTYSWTSTPSGFTSSDQNITVSPSTTTTYTVEVNDGYNTVSEDVVVTVNPLPTVSISSDEPDDTLCLGEDIVLTASGNADTYTWNNSVNNGVAFTPASTATYIVTATNNTSGCENYDTISIVVNSLPNVTAVSSDSDNGVCLGDSLYLYGSGNADVYSWNNGINDNEYFTPNATADYIVTGTDNTTACSNTDTITIQVYPVPSIDNVEVTNVTNCPNPDGSITITVSGGTTPYQYSIDAGSNFVSSDSFTGLNGGHYNLVVKDDNQCIDTASTNIINPSAPAIDSISVTNVACNGDNTGRIIIYSQGAAYYSIDNGTTTQQDSLFDNLSAGNYDIWVSDQGSCVSVDNVTITEPTAITITSNVTSAICGNTGRIELTVNGGTPGYSYLWNNNETTPDIDSLSADTYTCTVSDANSCQETISVVVPNEGQEPEISYTKIDVKCFGESTGSITAQLNTNNTPYSYTWSHDSNLNDSTATGLSAGTYYVTISDSYNCQADTVITISQPSSKLEVSIANYNNNLCYNDSTASISINVTGGTPDYNYLWSTGNTSQDLNNIPAGTYTVIVSDANDCKDTVSQEITSPSEIVVSDSTYIENHLGVIALQVSGGTPEYNFNWSNNENTSVVSGLLTGEYSVTISDANNCSVEKVYSIDIPFEIPTVITPNNDGKNDILRITGIEAYTKVSIRIFDRWGDNVYKYDGTGYSYYGNEWDGTFNGKDLPLGSYVYTIDYEKNTGDKQTKTGTITIVR